jgi:hypothetical protein
MLMTEQHFVVKKFFITLVSQARQLFTEANETTKAWYRAAVTPVFTQVQQHKIAIEQKLEMLRKINEKTIGQFKHCRQCRADAVGLIGQDLQLEKP